MVLTVALSLGVSPVEMRVATAVGRGSEFPVPTLSSDVTDITAGPDGNLWFTEHAANKIGRITRRPWSPSSRC